MAARCQQAFGLVPLVLAFVVACDETPEGPPPPSPLVTRALMDSDELIEIVPCRQSHEHELNHVRTVANPAAAEQFRRCVIDPHAAAEPCAEPFPEGSLFVKYEYELPGCLPEDFKGISANLKLAPDSYPAGRDWQWQKLSSRFKVEEDGAPAVCLICHLDHCSGLKGHDLRCLPD